MNVHNYVTLLLCYSDIQASQVGFRPELLDTMNLCDLGLWPQSAIMYILFSIDTICYFQMYTTSMESLCVC